MKNFYKKKVLITGHTGLKGSWLSLWLNEHGAKFMESQIILRRTKQILKILK